MTDITIKKTFSKPKLSLKTQTLAAIVAIAAAVAVPQLFHSIGIISGMGNIPGETFLPMHLPILCVGLLAGPYAGAAAGLLGPVVSFAMSGMPGLPMLPFMALELCLYGAITGGLRNSKMPTIAKVLLAQIGGRAVKAAAIIFTVYVIGNNSIGVPVIWNSIVSGIPGLVLQWSIIPLLIFWIENRSRA